MGAMFSKTTLNEPPKEGYTNVNIAYLIVFMILGVAGMAVIIRFILCKK